MVQKGESILTGKTLVRLVPHGESGLLACPPLRKEGGKEGRAGRGLAGGPSGEFATRQENLASQRRKKKKEEKRRERGRKRSVAKSSDGCRESPLLSLSAPEQKEGKKEKRRTAAPSDRRHLPFSSPAGEKKGKKKEGKEPPAISAPAYLRPPACPHKNAYLLPPSISAPLPTKEKKKEEKKGGRGGGL